MNREECIYNLIPKVIPEIIKPQRYTSKHDPKIKPTGSTFGCSGKSRLEGSNLGAESAKMDRPSQTKSFGKVYQKPDPKSYVMKGSKCKSVVNKNSKRRLKYRNCFYFLNTLNVLFNF